MAAVARVALGWIALRESPRLLGSRRQRLAQLRGAPQGDAPCVRAAGRGGSSCRVAALHDHARTDAFAEAHVDSRCDGSRWTGPLCRILQQRGSQQSNGASGYQKERPSNKTLKLTIGRWLETARLQRSVGRTCEGKLKHDAFVPLFLEAVARPALAHGYRWVGKSQSLAYDVGDTTVALIRLGGKKAMPGSIAHVLCARHKFLRSLVEESVPDHDTLSVNDYPYKWKPSGLLGVEPREWRYQPSNLGHWEYDRLQYDNYDVSSVRETLGRLHDLLLGPVAVWAAALSPARGLAELRQFGEGAWCERLWIEDYEAHLKRCGGAVQQRDEADGNRAG